MLGGHGGVGGWGRKILGASQVREGREPMKATHENLEAVVDKMDGWSE